jgi:hypothetical protein
MKTRVVLMAVIILFSSIASAWASSPPWTGNGTYTFSDTDSFFMENVIADTATVNIIGGTFGSLLCFDNSTVNMSGGIGDGIGTEDHSILNLRGGNVKSIGAINIRFEPNYSQIHIYALDYQVNTNSFLDLDQLTGHWENGSSFNMLVDELSWPNIGIHVIPEPGTLTLLAVGILFLKKRSA